MPVVAISRVSPAMQLIRSKLCATSPESYDLLCTGHNLTIPAAGGPVQCMVSLIEIGRELVESRNTIEYEVQEREVRCKQAQGSRLICQKVVLCFGLPVDFKPLLKLRGRSTRVGAHNKCSNSITGEIGLVTAPPQASQTVPLSVETL